MNVAIIAMGVLGLTYFIFDKFSRATGKRFRPTTRVYFDGNDVLHGSCARTEGNNVELVSDDVIEFMKDVMSRIENSVVEEIHFVIDGVCCVGKIQQQRIRRLTPSDEVKPYDALMLTSGTEFMQQLADVLQVKFNTHFTNAKVHYDVNAGEGEHVIFDLIEQAVSSDDTTNMIVGRDGDISNIAMMRKAKNVLIRTIKHSDAGEVEAFIDVDKYVELLEESDIDPQLWVVCMFLAGNDFLPHMFGIHSTFTPIGCKILNRIQGVTNPFQWNAMGVFNIVKMFSKDMYFSRQKNPSLISESERYDDVFVAIHTSDSSIIRSDELVQIKRCAVKGMPRYSEKQLNSAKLDALANYADVFLWNVAYYLGDKRVRSCEVYYKYAVPPCISTLNDVCYRTISTDVKKWKVFQTVNHHMTVEEQHSIVMPRVRETRSTHFAVEVFRNDKPDYRWTRVFMPIPCVPYSTLMYVKR